MSKCHIVGNHMHWNVFPTSWIMKVIHKSRYFINVITQEKNMLLMYTHKSRIVYECNFTRIESLLNEIHMRIIFL